MQCKYVTVYLVALQRFPMNMSCREFLGRFFRGFATPGSTQPVGDQIDAVQVFGQKILLLLPYSFVAISNYSVPDGQDIQ
jgi:hypothetical protein